MRASAKFTDLYSTSTRTIKNAMLATGIKRILVLSSGGTVDNDKAPCFYTKLLRPHLMNTSLDMARMETILEESPEFDWTVVRLTYLRKGASKDFMVEEGKLSGGNFQIHLFDAARFVLDELRLNDWVKGHPVLGMTRSKDILIAETACSTCCVVGRQHITMTEIGKASAGASTSLAHAGRSSCNRVRVMPAWRSEFRH